MTNIHSSYTPDSGKPPPWKVPIVLGNNKLEIVVTSESNTTRTYILNVYRPASNMTDVENIIPSSGSLSPSYNSEDDIYSLHVGSNVDKLSFNVITTDKNAIIKDK